MATPQGQGHGHQPQGTWDEVGGAWGFRPEHPTSCLTPAEKCHRQSYLTSPFVPKFATSLSSSPGQVGGVWIWPPPPPFAAREEAAGGSMVGSCPSRSAAFGDHLPVPLLLLHQPGGEQGGGLGDPPERDHLKAQGRDTHLRLRTSVSSMSRSWAARNSSRRCW